ncbi:MAG: cyclopropane-fatty-acyl-phospholipid synthase [Lysobacteraceae bacterium]|nr:MAG: cyclopropane-fatty-acyl-phospholipid synthase [Xanthomonadaceae bacterium]
MNESLESPLEPVPRTRAAGATAGRGGALAGFLRRRLIERLAALRGGSIRLVDGDLDRVLGEPADGCAEPLRCTLRVEDPEFYLALARHGSVGAAEAYMDGAWHCDDLVALVRILVRNRALLDGMEQGTARLGGLLMRAWHALRRNTRGGSRRNIAAHYDLGNALFELFLDRSMMYSSAIFADATETLEQAQQRKLDRICRKLQLGPASRVVEIGTGWGGFALHAARHYGAHVTTTTISQQQFELARARVEAEGLGDRITLLLRDYRELDGQYDALVSIEMIEAIGHQYLDTYFAKVASLLRRDGMALIQAITIEDHRYRQALRSVDFIKRHIFPGSFIPSVSAMLEAAAKTDLRLFNLEDIGPSYALTLRHWRQRFLAHVHEVRAQGYPDRFIRMWEFYLAYCEGGFLERSIGDVQMLLTRPDCRRPSWLPDLS